MTKNFCAAKFQWLSAATFQKFGRVICVFGIDEKFLREKIPMAKRGYISEIRAGDLRVWN